ncbi:hypothetical protein B0T17DRAFT_652892 [Bombardia bombarda]|uniref:Alpha/beta hydrolase fold-3 domain-containing protein n=1 Tax=Bombardia bombarda TaxID=252184 RepID=A0AA40C881_9PEZI|nr:hypothetical protein B0T17DRAFT_652892 [Bombardia bombarda]
MNMNTATVGLAVTPTVVSTLVSHYLGNTSSRQKHPTAHISYDEGLHLIRSFLEYASRHTVEELQAFTSQWVPHPQWVKVDEVEISQDHLSRAAFLMQEQLGPEGIRQVGGKEWWQWRKPRTPLKAEWIEMKADYHDRKKRNDPGNRVMLYVHGGAYFFGSVDEHRYQIQRHARKLKARALAPRYRLAPQFPFPCGLYDCLATYLYLLEHQAPNTIILAGDSAGGGMVLSLLVILRDRGIPLPAGAILISPWVDLTHSFPSVAGDSPLDYIPPSGFHHKPSPSWPPPDEELLEEIKKIAVHQKKNIAANEGGSELSSGIPTISDVAETTTRLSLIIDGEHVDIKEQIQMYTTNELLAHPLVSPVMQPTLGGLPPLLIMVGGGEMLCDEQIYVAHKCANPARYAPPDALMDEHGRAQLAQHKPTDVQLQVWDDLCHVAPTLSFTSPAKYQYRAIAQFGAWALARAQRVEIDIPDDDAISVISSSSSSSSSDDGEHERQPKEKRGHKRERQKQERRKHKAEKEAGEISVGQAGDALPPFKGHMIRQRVTPHGLIFPLPPAEELPGCTMACELVGVIKVGPVRKWLAHKRRWDARFQSVKRKVHENRLRDMAAGFEVFGEGEFPPPSALAGRRKLGAREKEMRKQKKSRSYGLSLWALWGSKHDEMTVQRGQLVGGGGGGVETKMATGAEGQGARAFSDLERQEVEEKEGKGKDVGGRRADAPPLGRNHSSGHRFVGDEGQTEESGGAVADEDGETPIATLLAIRRGKMKKAAEDGEGSSKADGGGLLAPPETGVTGKRPIVDGISVPFSLGRKDADTASMMTLMSDAASRNQTPRLGSPVLEKPSGLAFGGAEEGEGAAGENAAATTDGRGDDNIPDGVLQSEAGQEGGFMSFPSPHLASPAVERFASLAASGSSANK